MHKLLRKANAALDDTAGHIKYMVKGDPHFYEEAQVWRQRMRRWDPRNWADLSVSGLAGKRGTDDINYTHDITDSMAFRLELNAIHARRDEQCRDYLATHAYRPAKLALIKYSHRVSDRRCAWINSMLKFDHSARDAKGERLRVREVMCEGSTVRAPELFNTKMLREMQMAELGVDSQSMHVQHDDAKGGSVRDVAAAVLRVLERAEKDSACGGMSTSGKSPETAHWLMLSMDGAGVSRAESGVRLVMYPGSVRKMNQSIFGITNLVQYKAASHAESYETLEERCAFIRPQLCKIYEDGYVTSPDGTRIYIKFMLTADKSGMAHLMGRRSINYDAFGLQCDCCDKADQLFDLSQAPLSHFDNVTYRKRVARSHRAWHQAMETDEPDNWTVCCDCCDRVRRAAHCCCCARPTVAPPSQTFTKKEILDEEERVDQLSAAELKKYCEDFSARHFGQNYREDPILPYHDACTDILHLYLNIVKKSLASVFHVPLQLDKRKYAKKLVPMMTDLRDKVNARMKEEFVEKQFGGEGDFSLTGDQVKVFMRGGRRFKLIPDLLRLMRPYFEMLEGDGTLPSEYTEAAGGDEKEAPAAAPAAAEKAKNQRGRKAKIPTANQHSKAPPKPAAKSRGGGGTAFADRTIKKRARPAEEGEPLCGEGADAEARQTDAGGSEPPPAQDEIPVETASYEHRCITMFLALSGHYAFTHDVNARDAKEISAGERGVLAGKAYEKGCDVVQAVTDVVGTELRQTYLHDIVYGLQKLFLLLGKPYLGATEGNEHAHQEMKRDYQLMCCHSNSRGDMVHSMDLAHMRRASIGRGKEFASHTRESERTLGMDMGLGQGKRACKRHDDAIPIADGHLKAAQSALEKASETSGATSDSAK